MCFYQVPWETRDLPSHQQQKHACLYRHLVIFLQKRGVILSMGNIPCTKNHHGQDGTLALQAQRGADPSSNRAQQRTWRDWPGDSYFLQQTPFLLLKTQPQLPPSRKAGFPLPFPDTNAYKLGSLRLTSRPVCKQEAAEVGGCETCKPEDSSEVASVRRSPI